MSSDNTPATRRRVLQSLGAATAAGLAGCGGGGGDQTPTTAGDGDVRSPADDQQDQQELGERVPKITIQYFSTLSIAPTIESHLQALKEDMSNRLGVTIEPGPTETTTEISQFIADERTSNLYHILIRNKPQRLDPQPLIDHFLPEAAGNQVVGTENLSQYHVSERAGTPNACDYRDTLQTVKTTLDRETRQKAVTEIGNLITEDIQVIPFTNIISRSLYRTDQVNTSDEILGELGSSPQNPDFYIKSTPKQGDTLNVQSLVRTVQSMQPTRRQDGNVMWGSLIHSGLRQYTPDLGLRNVLAKSIEQERDNTRIIVELLDDALFHNGDPVTAEDVAFTFNYLNEHPEGATEYYPFAANSIEPIDDKTVEFDLPTPAPLLTFANFPMMGIWHKESMIEAGAVENPAEYSFDQGSDIVGSGPFKIDNAEPGQSMRLVPFEDHPVYDVDHNIQLQAFSNKQTAIQAFKNGDISTLFGVKQLIYENLNQRDNMNGLAAQGWSQHALYPQVSFPPSLFKEFRHAFALAIDRQKMNNLAQGGLATEQLHGGAVPNTHPWFEKDKVNTIEGLSDPTGHPQKAKQVLRDAGWGWDDNGNLHYPADADLTPAWPKGENVDPSTQPCLDSEGNYVPPGER